MSTRARSAMATGAQAAPRSARSALTNLGIFLITVMTLGALISGARLLVKQSTLPQPKYVSTLQFVIFFSVILLIYSILMLFRERLNVNLTEGWYAGFAALVYFIFIIIIPAGNDDFNTLNLLVDFGILSVLVLLYSIRPNYGPEANKRIYQAYASIIAAAFSLILLIAGIFVLKWFEIDDYAGTGTYPDNEQYVEYYIYYVAGNTDAPKVYEAMINSGYIMIAGALIIMFFALIRKLIGPLICSLLILTGAILFTIGMGLFNHNFNLLAKILAENFGTGNPLLLISDDYRSPPMLLTASVYIVGIEYLAAGAMLYATFVAKPVDKWRNQRDKFIAAAEVAIREQRLLDAVKYLNKAAELSSKIDEEDKSIELLTRVKQIQDKAIKLRKAEAAKKAKREYERQRRMEARKKAAASKAKQPPKKAKPAKAKAPPKKPEAGKKGEKKPAEGKGPKKV